MDTRANFSVTVVLGWVFFLVCNPAAAATYSGGSGTADDPYLISTAEDMQSIGANKGDWNKHFVLTDNIDLSCYTGTEFNIIGYYKSYYDNKPFTAVFDGNDHTISNFTYTTTDTDHIGLFGYVNSADAVIKNLTLVNPDVNAAGDSCYVGSLVGKLRSGTITGCGIEGGSVTGYGGTGGLMGENDGTISNCYATVSVIGYVGYVCTGGLVGSNHGTISNCYATGSVTGGNDCTGGLLGWNGDGTISNCYATGSVTGDNRIGGLVGGNYKAAVFASFWDIETTGQSGSYGGEGKTTAQMKTASTFVGWAACGNELWTIDEGQDYPRLAWEGRPGELLPIQELSDFLTGSGTAADPYLICTAQQLNLIGLFICEWDRHFVLTNDIDLSGYTGTQFNIIGQHYRDRETQEWIENPFTGVFDGNGFTISNFTYKFTRTGYIGLFGYIDDADAVVKDLTLTDPNVEVYRDWDWDWDWDCGTSALVGELKAGTITGCSVDGGSVTGNNHTGGLVGYNNYKGTISNCYASGCVTGDNNTGGLVGCNEGTISNCYVAGGVTATGYDIGGLVGSNYGTISNCYAAGTVTGNLWNRWVGGLVGRNGGTIENCYATGSVTGDDYIGGLAGQNYDGTISNCYATGSVTGDDYTGGLVGSNYRAAVFASFWDIETTGQSGSYGGEGKTTVQMKTMSTFFAWAGCENEEVWTIDEGNNYPRLAWEGRPGQPLQQLSDFLTGSGTGADPYLIYTAEQLNLIGLFICERNRHFLLATDIDLSGATCTEFNIIGTRYFPFTGVFDGNGHTISNFTYTATDTDYIGVFGYMNDPNAVIKDLTLVAPNVKATGHSGHIGCLIGELRDGTVTGCGIEGGSISGHHEVTGGLVGRNSGTISNCYAAAGVTGRDGTGGLVGSNGGTISNCYVAGSISGDDHTGGLAGTNSGTISNCYAVGNVTGERWIGGLVGENYRGTISNCYATGIVDGNDFVGGLIGYDYENSGDYTKSFWDKEVNPDVNGIGNADDPNVIGESTVNMQTESTFTDAGWDFDMPVWKICEAVDYPRLEWEMIDWPVIDEEPEVTTGTSNTISWQQVDEAIEYYAICCSDDNLENVVAESGWVDVNEYTFDNLETPQTYWYAVKARQNCVLESDWSDVVSSLQGTLGDAVDVMLDTDSLKNSNMKNALMNKIEQVLEMIDAGLYEDALKKLENDILKKTDGCIKTGQADKNDWIKTCEAQQQIYPFVMDTIDYVNSLSQ